MTTSETSEPQSLSAIGSIVDKFLGKRATGRTTRIKTYSNVSSSRDRQTATESTPQPENVGRRTSFKDDDTFNKVCNAIALLKEQYAVGRVEVRIVQPKPF